MCSHKLQFVPLDNNTGVSVENYVCLEAWPSPEERGRQPALSEHRGPHVEALVHGQSHTCSHEVLTVDVRGLEVQTLESLLG